MYHLGNNLDISQRSSNILAQKKIHFFFHIDRLNKWKITFCDMKVQHWCTMSPQPQSIHLVSLVRVYFLHSIAKNMYFPCFLAISFFFPFCFLILNNLKIMVIFFHFCFHTVFIWIRWLFLRYFHPKYALSWPPGSR